MTSAPTIDVLTDRPLMSVYSAGAWQRGQAYAQQRRANVLSDEPGRLRGVVAGSGNATYLVSVTWAGSHDRVMIDDTCSCPVGMGCKHAVALILTARRDRKRTPSSWRGALAGILSPEEHSTAAGVEPLALQLDVQEDRSTHSYRYIGPSGHSGPSGPRPVVRPMRLGRNGRWIRTGTSWRDLSESYRGTLDRLDTTQRAVLVAMLSSARSGMYYVENRAYELREFGSDVWFHLARAVDVGVTLLGPGDDESRVALSAVPAQVNIDLTTDEDGSVRLSVLATVDGGPLPVDPDHLRMLGDPAHGLYAMVDGVLHLVPLAEPLHPDLARLLGRNGVVVPPEEVDELVDEYQPLLARLVPIGSSDGSVSLAQAELDGMVLSIDRRAVDAATARWLVRYRRGVRTIDHPLRGGGSRNRDRVEERKLAIGIEVPTHLLAALAGPDGAPSDVDVNGPEAVRLLTEVVPWLEAQGQVQVEIRADEQVPELRESTADPLISLSVKDGTGREGTDWFDLEVEVTVDGEVVPLPILIAALTHDEAVVVLPSGTWLRVDRPELARLKELIDEARGLADPAGRAAARVNRFQVSWWEELAGLGVIEQQSQRWADSVTQLGELGAPEPVPVPPGLSATLRPYQQEGLDWLVFLYRNQLGGILADDMGLGKTLQTLGLCLHALGEQPAARFLVVAPTSVVENWHLEAERFVPGVAVRTISETAKRRGTQLAEAVEGASIVVTSYALFRIEFEAYHALDWDLLLLDEAQFVKNHQAKGYGCARRLDVATKIAITGTPLENSLMDLWSLLSITAPGLYPDPKRFSEVYRKPIERGDAPELLATLRRRIAPLMRRRTKDAVLTELPPKIEQTIPVELSARHARIYQTQLQRQRQKVLGLVGDVQRNRFEILKSLTLMRQLSLDPGLVDPAHDEVGSAKLDRLEEDLVQVLAERHRALVFSQFTRYLARVRARLDAAGIAHTYLDGRTRKRAEAIARFTDGEVPVFVISLKAGGFGLNLTQADYCFVLDPWWNPAVETQAVDRAHRIGQQNPVVVYRYVSTGTIEEKVMELKARKAAIFANVLDADGALSGALTETDIRGLLDLA